MHLRDVPMNSVAIALNRFGLGARPADPQPSDAKRWLLSQFERFEPRPQALAAVPARVAVVQQLADYMAEAKAERQTKRQLQPASMPIMQEKAGDELPDSAKKFLRQSIREDYVVMNGARLSSALQLPRRPTDASSS